MDSNKSNPNPQTPSDTSSKYQDILDQYSKQITTVPDTENEDETLNPDGILETSTVGDDPQAAPIPQTPTTLDAEASPSPSTFVSPSLQRATETLQPIQSVQDVQSPSLATIPQTEEPVIPANDPPVILTTNTNPPEAVTKGSNFFKILFFISLLIFLVVASSLALSFINNSKTTPGTVSPAIPTITEPTDTPEEEAFCFLNDNKYKINETFPAADGCNTCTCGLDGTISCTEKACNE